MNYFQELSSELVCTVNLYINYIDFNILNLTLNLNFDYSKILVFKYPAFYTIVYGLIQSNKYDKYDKYDKYSYEDVYNLISNAEIVKQYYLHNIIGNYDKIMYGLRTNNVEDLIEYIYDYYINMPGLKDIIHDYKLLINQNYEKIKVLQKYKIYFPKFKNIDLLFDDACTSYMNLLCNDLLFDEIVNTVHMKHADTQEVKFKVQISHMYILYLAILDKPEVLVNLKTDKSHFLHIHSMLDPLYFNYEFILIYKLILEKINA
jgi:hypothetical protein